MNENKWINNPLALTLEMEIMITWPKIVIMMNHDYKTNNGRNFQFTKFSFNDFVLTDRSLSGKRPKSASDKSSSCRFSFSAERNTNTKATKCVASGFSFSILVFFPFCKSLNLTVRQQYVFLSILAALIRGFSRQTTCIKNREGFAVLSSTWPSGAKGEWRVSSWLPISTREKIRYFFTCAVKAFLRAGNSCIAPQFM